MVMTVGKCFSVRSLLLCLLLFFLCFFFFLWWCLLRSLEFSSLTSSTLRLLLIFLDLSLDFLRCFSLLFFLCFVDNTGESPLVFEWGSVFLDASSKCLVLYFLFPPGLLVWYLLFVEGERLLEQVLERECPLSRLRESLLWLLEQECRSE